MISYPAVLTCPWELLYFVSNLLRQERIRLGTRRGRRALSTHAQAKMVLCRLRSGTDLDALAAGFGVSRATAQRYCAEAIRTLSGQAPDLQDLIDLSSEQAWAYTIVDGTLIRGPRIASKAAKHRAAANLAAVRGEAAPPPPAGWIHIGDLEPGEPETDEQLEAAMATAGDPEPDRPASKTKQALVDNAIRAHLRNDPSYSGKHYDHGMNVQFVTDPSGRIRYAGDATAGRVYDAKAAEAAGLPAALAQTLGPTLADLAYISIPGWTTPIKKVKSRELTTAERATNKKFAARRFRIEWGIWQLVGHWRILRHNPGNPSETTDTVRACLVLNNFRLDGHHRTPRRHAT